MPRSQGPVLRRKCLKVRQRVPEQHNIQHIGPSRRNGNTLKTLLVHCPHFIKGGLSGRADICPRSPSYGGSRKPNSGHLCPSHQTILIWYFLLRIRYCIPGGGGREGETSFGKNKLRQQKIKRWQEEIFQRTEEKEGGHMWAINNCAPRNDLQFMQLLVTHWYFISCLLLLAPTVPCLYLHCLHWNIEAFSVKDLETGMACCLVHETSWGWQLTLIIKSAFRKWSVTQEDMDSPGQWASKEKVSDVTC